MVKTFILLCSFTVLLLAQSEDEQKFLEALSLYNADNFQKSLELFDEISFSEDNSPYRTSALIFKGKSELNLSKLKEAEETFQKFLEIYPQSKYADEARLALAKANYEQKEYFDAVKDLTNIIKNSSSQSYISDAKEAAQNIALKFLSPALVQTQIDLSTDLEVQAFLKFIIAKNYYLQKDFSKAKSILNEIVKDYKNSEEAREAEKLLTGLSSEKGSVIQSPLIAALIPLTGTDLSFQSALSAKEILEGFKYAVSIYNSEKQKKIGLVVKDTEMKRENIEQIKNEIKNIPQFKAVLGPIFSSEVRETLEEFNGLNIPIISPTATDNDLTALNEYFFQANPAFSVRGKIMAQYIYFVENKRKMAILNAIDGYSPLLAAVFKDEFTKLGGEIIIDETYKSNSFNLGNPVGEIMKQKDLFEGIYLPLADKVDAAALLSNLGQYDFNKTIYGNQDWIFASGFESSSQLSNLLTFTSDYFIDYNNEEYIRFSRNFYEASGMNVTRNVLYGYDAAKYLLEVMSESNGERESIKNKMESGFAYSGFHNNISFDINRINNFLNIVRYKEGKFELIDKFKAGL